VTRVLAERVAIEGHHRVQIADVHCDVMDSLDHVQEHQGKDSGSSLGAFEKFVESLAEILALPEM
jgi:hypothetical protein